ncbi:hypothetical protein PROFUN_16215 [Planoprotostelium fungivorum]|uniref:Uncharacterized protein n=1 Tax=Planoprotostelium fungivorum TaxID=1890364 RepID=A0A2P6MNN2_9EUKA|nr:hypothetical protein PROFUN_16215 [Planoprotostelium fungivorum]
MCFPSEMKICAVHTSLERRICCGLSHRDTCGLSHRDMQFHVMESSTPVWAHVLSFRDEDMCCSHKPREQYIMWSQPRGHVWSQPQGHAWSQPQGHVWSQPQGHASAPNFASKDSTGSERCLSPFFPLVQIFVPAANTESSFLWSQRGWHLSPVAHLNCRTSCRGVRVGKIGLASQCLIHLGSLMEDVIPNRVFDRTISDHSQETDPGSPANDASRKDDRISLPRDRVFSPLWPHLVATLVDCPLRPTGRDQITGVKDLIFWPSVDLESDELYGLKRNNSQPSVAPRIAATTLNIIRPDHIDQRKDSAQQEEPPSPERDLLPKSALLN